MSERTSFRFARWERSGPVAEVVRIRKGGARGKLTVRGEAEASVSTRELNVCLHPWLRAAGVEIEFELGTEDAQRPGLDLAVVAALRGLSAPGTLYYGELDLQERVRSVRGALMAARATRARQIITGPLEHPGAPVPYDILCVRNVAAAPTRALPKANNVAYAVTEVPVRLQGALLALRDAFAAKQAVLLVGQPGVGKTLVTRAAAAERALSPEASVSVAETADAAGLCGGVKAPLRAPHHTVSDAAMRGAGRSWRPGEFDLARHGTLFLDEVSEFRPAIVEDALKRAAAGHFSLVGAANPCGCGYFGSSARHCACTAAIVGSYTRRLNRAAWDVVVDLVEPPTRTAPR